MYTNSAWRLCGDEEDVIKFDSINITGDSTLSLAGSTYTINASPTNASNQSVVVTINGDGRFDSESSSVTSKTITLTNGSGTITIESKAGKNDTSGTITVTPVVSSTGSLSATKNVTFQATYTLETITETFNVWKTGSTVNSKWLNTNESAVTTNTILSELNDDNNNTYI